MEYTTTFTRAKNSFPGYTYSCTQKEYDEHQREVLKERIFDGELCIKDDKKLRDLSFIEKFDVKKLVLENCTYITHEFSSQTVKELHIDKLETENFRKIKLESLETLKILRCAYIKECHYIAQVTNLELFRANVEQLFSNQICNNMKELILNYCKIQSLDALQIQNIEVLHLKDHTSKFHYSPNLLNIQSIKMYHQLKELFLEGYADVDTTPLQQLKNLSTVKIEECNNIIINFKSESFKDLLLNCCIFKSIDSFQLPNIEKLSIVNFCVMNLDNINQFTKLKELDLSGNQQLDLSLLSDLTYISSLNLSGCKLQDCTIIDQLARQNYMYNDIFPLRYLTQLEKLYLRSCGINLINVLSFMVNLKELDLTENECSDLTPLQTLFKLTKLNLENCNLSNIGSLQLLVNLEELNLSKKIIEKDDIFDAKNVIQDQNSFRKIQLGPLATLVNLKCLQLTGNILEDLTVIQYLTNLITLDMHSCLLSDVHILKTLPNLKELYLSKNPNIDITSLQFLTNLMILDLRQCQLSRLDALKTLVKLKELNLSQNPILDITPLQYLTQITKLQLNHCELISIDALATLLQLTDLQLYSNKIVYAQTLSTLKIDKLTLVNNKIIDLSSNFSEQFDISNKRPTEQEIYYANILKNINYPITILKSINLKRKNLNNSMLVRKNVVNVLMNKQVTSYVSVTEKVVQHFQQQIQNGNSQ
ncbi:Conserved_hypothetical protein [Hexamita inflata]|uniref:Uncharacterized protein n=1 Tax=Hexamita inflata TaxID=28002 RepID=A0AA86N6N2_9EUKA|nr:Conserved hypothetical protein [Hexamita inflata]